MHRTTLLAFVVFLLLHGLHCQPAATAAEKPNVVVILVDDLGYGDLSSYGAKDLTTPNIDALMSAGMRLNEFYANCPVCSPTRASLLTGRYPERVGVPGVIRTHLANNWGYLAKEATLLPEALKPAGYHSAIVGKWHLGLESPNRPNDRGFDHFHGFLGDMMDDYYKHQRHGIEYMRLNETPIDPQGHATDLFSQWASEYLESRVGKQEPFCLYLAYNAPHTPIQPPKDWLQKVKQRLPNVNPRRAALIALIEHMDYGIGQVMKTLQETKLAENTVVFFTSDNGGQINVGADNGGLRDGKQSMYEGGLKVPFCAVWPGKIEPGSTAPAVGITMDLFPTICEIAGAPIEHTIDSVSLLPVLTGKQQELPQRTLFFHRREGGDRYGGLTIHGVLDGPWKLLQNSPFAPFELYNLENDPVEANNLATKQRGKFRELRNRLQVHLQQGGAVPWQPPRRRDDASNAAR